MEQTPHSLECPGNRIPGPVNRLAIGLLLLGLLWRVVRYFLQFPIWGDEALLAMNFAWFDYGQLLVRLENCQIAPLLFLWGERAAFSWLGPGELSLRLFPFLAGVAALLLFWRLTGLLLTSRARLFAVGYLAVAIWPVSMSTLIKPYSFDLLMTLLLLVPTVQWLQRPDQWGWLALLAILAPLTLLGSYPTVFVAGGVSLALLPTVWRGSWSIRSLYAAFNLSVLLGFALAYTIGNNHLDTATGGVTTREGMAAYWAKTFPPQEPLALLWWFFLQTTGQMAAYPIGASNGGSILTVLIGLVGLVWWARRGQWTWIALLGAPLALNLLAGLIHRYPYGGSCRLCQHLAPTFCIFAGVGLAALIQQIGGSVPRRRWVTLAMVGYFGVIGVVGLGRDVAFPYRDAGYVWMRSSMQLIRAEINDGNPIVVSSNPQQMECVFAWYWLLEGKQVSWDYQIPETTQTADRIWGFHHGMDGDIACQRMLEELQRRDSAWQLVRRVPHEYRRKKSSEPLHRCELFCFERSAITVAAARSR